MVVEELGEGEVWEEEQDQMKDMGRKRWQGSMTVVLVDKKKGGYWNGLHNY